jgi:hypothetical protein
MQKTNHYHHLRACVISAAVASNSPDGIVEPIILRTEKYYSGQYVASKDGQPEPSFHYLIIDQQ